MYDSNYLHVHVHCLRKGLGVGARFKDCINNVAFICYQDANFDTSALDTAYFKNLLFSYRFFLSYFLLF